MDLGFMCGLEDIDLGSVESANLLSLMECPVCLDHITPPVKQCVKGHLVMTIEILVLEQRPSGHQGHQRPSGNDHRNLSTRTKAIW
jgi:hypothetical protein